MYRRASLLIVLATTALLLVACVGPSQEYMTGEILLNETFRETGAWEKYVGDEEDLQVSDGVYRIQTEGIGYIWGLNKMEHTDVVMEVTTNHISTFGGDAYGIMCRADVSNNGDGYYFLINGNGFYSIRKGEGRDVLALIDWTANANINKGQTTNKIRAVCIDNYLALWVNDKFLAETEDTAYTNGYAGLAAAASEDENADVTFDDLTIMAASLSN